MKISHIKRHRAGYVSFLLVLATGSVLTALMFGAYRRALGAQMVETKVQLRTDYGEKEEAILRAIVAITPNQAIRAMKTGSAVAGTPDAPLGWPGIFAAALAAANSQNSISAGMMNSLDIPNLKSANAGDGALGNLDRIFTAVPNNLTAPIENGMISAGINRSLAGSYPPPLTSTDATTISRDFEYPIISDLKQYGALAQASLDSAALNGNVAGAYGLPVSPNQKFNRLRYPATSFGYAKPGDPFVAKRNWWAFSLNVGNHDGGLTGVVRPRRDFVLSIYEIPSQLPISAASSMLIGNYASGAAWQNNTTIEGNISVGRAELTGGTALTSLSLRRGLTNSSATSIDGVVSATPFDPGTAAAAGIRERYQIDKDKENRVSLANQTTMGSFFPVSMASESGRAAFIPISQGRGFFDRFDVRNGNNDPVEAAGARNHIGKDTLSSTTWNNYSVGAQQCAMRLDIIEGNVGANPTMLRFEYFTDPNTRQSRTIPLFTRRDGRITTLPDDFRDAGVAEGGTITLTTPTDIAYGAPGGYTFRYGVEGPITFNNSTFADPIPGVVKRGFWRKTAAGISILPPFAQHASVGGQTCIVVYPERIPVYLGQIGAADVATNKSLAVNVDYSVTGLNSEARRPNFPCQVTDYGLVLKECDNLTTFTQGFSLVTNLRLFIGDHLNRVAMPGGPPAGCVPAATPENPLGQYLPPCSFFAPEKRYGGNNPEIGAAPIRIIQRGQVGSLAEIDQVLPTDDNIRQIRPLDAQLVGNRAVAPINMTNDLSQIRHPAEVPPISMMNWLVLLEEVR
jgi:hypothetical protein